MFQSAEQLIQGYFPCNTLYELIAYLKRIYVCNSESLKAATQHTYKYSLLCWYNDVQFMLQLYTKWFADYGAQMNSLMKSDATNLSVG